MRRRPHLGRKLALKAKLAAGEMRERVDERIAAWRPLVTLESVHRRLELLLMALYGRSIAIAPTDGTSTVHGDSIHLPRDLAAPNGEAEALMRYRLFAVEQAERLVRGTAALAPSDDPLIRDLYHVREAAAIDAHIAQTQPGLRGALEQERKAALEKRPRISALTATEREVESLLREALSVDPAAAVDVPHDPESSLEWARETASRVRRAEVAYRGMKPADVWGTLPLGNARPTDWRREHARPMEHLVQRKYWGGRTESDSEAATGRTKAAAEKYNENTAASEVPEEKPTEDSASRPGRPTSSGAAPSITRPDLAGLPPATWYDEWDVFAGAYRKRVAGVRVSSSDDGDDEWAGTALRDHAALVRKIRHEFERLRARRMLLPRQRSGDEIDVSAVVNAMVDRQIGQGGEDRLYMAARPARRGLAISLLADVSGSTKAPVSDGRTIIDLEKIALLLACDALDALGDRYAAYAFAGKSAENVKITCLKDFHEQSGPAVQRRIGALIPGGFTRLGAAVRYATAQLAAESAGHRLLLLLSDGKPNDLDWYQGDYGIEDARQSILEARAVGVYPFCLTIDANAAEYLPRIFGATGHTILTGAKQLPTALLGVVRGLIRKG
jgi:nitric oxide reductase NorD protein